MNLIEDTFMAKTPRLQVPVKPETRVALDAYAEAIGVGAAAAAGQLLEESAPALTEIAAALRKAKSSPAKALQKAAATLNKATEEADQLSLELNKKMRKKAS